MEKERKIKQILKLLVMFLGVILIFFILGKLTGNKKEEEKNPRFGKEIEGSKEKKEKEIKDLYPNIEDKSLKEINISSPEIEEMVKENLNVENIGSKYVEYDGFKNFFNKGIEVKEVLGDVLALRFSTKYKNNIIANVKVSDNPDEIIKKIGEPNIKYKNFLLYILEGTDIVFNTELKTVTAYKTKNSDKTNYQFLIDEYEKFLKTKDLKKFISTLTKKNPKYYRYKYDEDKVLLDYFDLGVRIIFNKDSNTNGMYIFQNFTKSENYDENKLQDLKEKNLVAIEDKRLSLVEEMYVNEKEQKIIQRSEDIRNLLAQEINGDKLGLQTEDTEIYYENGEGERKYKNIIIWSKKNSFPKHYLNQVAYASSLAVFEDKIVYAIDNDGIYEVYADGNTAPNKIYEPEEPEEIKFEYIDFKNRLIYFNQKSINIK